MEIIIQLGYIFLTFYDTTLELDQLMDAIASKVSQHNKAPKEGCVRVGPVAAIPDLLRKYSTQSPEHIFSEVGLDLALFENPENSISFIKAGQLLKQCAKSTGLPHFGLLVGQHAGPDSLGRLSEFAIHSPDAGSALKNMILHLTLHDRGSIPSLTIKEGTAMVEYATYLPLQGGSSQISMVALTNICNVMRALCGETWAPSQVLFTHAQPENIHPYSSVFNAPINFNADMNALIFPEHWLDKKIPGADPEQYHKLVEELTTIQSRASVDLIEQIRSILFPLIVSGNCTEERLARMLSMHPRTLNRRLKERDTSFRSLLAESRFEISKRLLEESDISIIRISAIIGYADQSIFTRAFHRWSGASPKEWRSQHG